MEMVRTVVKRENKREDYTTGRKPLRYTLAPFHFHDVMFGIGGNLTVPPRGSIVLCEPILHFSSLFHGRNIHDSRLAL